MPLSPHIFRREFNRFREVVRRVGGAPFTSFDAGGLPDDWEGYKLPLRDKALGIMRAAKWRAEQIGSGGIVRSVIGAIEIPTGDGLPQNNLVRWENRFGHASRSHRKLLDALDDPAERRSLERLFFDFYQGRLAASNAFEQLLDLVGKRYDLLAYLCFLSDSQQFMPIAPTTFDQAFELLGLDVVTTHRCSWTNYVAYNAALSDVQAALKDVGRLPEARLIDAHSFCWMLVRLTDEDDAADVKPEGPARERGKPLPGRVFDARERSVWEMAQTVEETVKNALGPPVEKAPKRKELRMSRQQLENHIKQLLKRQGDRCALTGIKLQFRREQADAQLLPSLDRIDSDGHYAVGNLQVVCRFVNHWKGSADDEEFRRLLSLVRGSDN